MSKKPDYADLVAQAEKAVTSVKDPDLKRIAFQKVLDNLLSGAPVKPKPESSAGSTKKRASTSKERGGKGGPKAYIEELVDEKFFSKPKTIAMVKAALENRGYHIPITSLSGPLQKLCQDKMLRRERLKDSGTYAYSKW